MLDEFTPSKPEPPPSSSKPTQAPPSTNPIADGISDEEFAKQLQAGMAELMGELDTSPDMQSQLEQMLKELGGVAALDATANASAGLSAAKETASSSKEVPSKAGPSDESFQETIKKTMERMQNSGDQATAAAASDNTDDILAQMMKAMESGGLDGEGGEEEFSKMLLGMMEQLTNKEILYEPMKELDDKFPAWMKENEGKVDVADMKRYKEQQVYVSEIVKRFETKTYTDDNSKDREYIVERMQKVCSSHCIILEYLLTSYRCKQLAHPLLTWWEIWQQHRKHLVPLKKAVRHNEQVSNAKYSKKYPCDLNPVIITVILTTPCPTHPLKPEECPITPTLQNTLYIWKEKYCNTNSCPSCPHPGCAQEAVADSTFCFLPE